VGRRAEYTTWPIHKLCTSLEENCAALPYIILAGVADQPATTIPEEAAVIQNSPRRGHVADQ